MDPLRPQVRGAARRAHPHPAVPTAGHPRAPRENRVGPRHGLAPDPHQHRLVDHQPGDDRLRARRGRPRDPLRFRRACSTWASPDSWRSARTAMRSRSSPSGSRGGAACSSACSAPASSSRSSSASRRCGCAATTSPSSTIAAAEIVRLLFLTNAFDAVHRFRRRAHAATTPISARRTRSRRASYGFGPFGLQRSGAGGLRIVGLHRARPRGHPGVAASCAARGAACSRASARTRMPCARSARTSSPTRLQALILGGVFAAARRHHLRPGPQRQLGRLRDVPDVLRLHAHCCSAARRPSSGRSSARSSSGSLQTLLSNVLPALASSGILPFMSSIQAATLRFILIGIVLMLLVIFRPQGHPRQQEGADLCQVSHARGADAAREDDGPAQGRDPARRREGRPDHRRRRRAPHLRRPDRGRRRSPRDPARRHHGADRSQRRRQDDAVQPAHRFRQARPWHLDLRGDESLGHPGLQGRPARPGAHLPAHQGARAAHGAREHEARGQEPAGRRILAEPHPRPLAQAGRRDRGARARAAQEVQARRQEGRLRGEPLRRPAQAARDGPRAHERTPTGDAR